MKILCFILSIFVLVLSTVPCCTDDNCDDEIKTEKSTKDSHNENKGFSGCCSPFLTCGSCVGFTFSNQTFTFESPKVFIKNVTLIPSYKVPFVDDFFSKIWQPPKIS